VGAARFERTLRLRFGNCDPSGIIFYPQYFVLFNDLVEDWVGDGLGIAFAELIGPRRVGMPTVSLHTEFIAASRFGDELALGLQVEHLGSRSLVLALDARCGAQQRVTVRQAIVTTNLDSHQAIAIPPDLRRAIERFRRPPQAAQSPSTHA